MKRVWTVEVDPTEADREEALADAINEAGRQIGSLDRLGGTLIVTALRQRTGEFIGPEPEYLTVGFVFTWDSYAPGIELPEPTAEAEPELEPDVELEPDLEPEAVPAGAE